MAAFNQRMDEWMLESGVSFYLRFFMPDDQLYKLDNPAWYALEETHRHFAISKDGLRRYQPAIVSFLAFDHSNAAALQKLDQLTMPEESFFIINEFPALPHNYIVESVLTCEQMICEKLINASSSGTAVHHLDEKDEEQMLALVNLVQPGYFLPGTRLMGHYYGIKKQGELVAMTGERIKLVPLTEISAVVTHPSYTGRGYAQQLVAHSVGTNLEAGLIPFLHVAASNERAITLYNKLGFTRRRLINFSRIRRTH